MLSPDPTTSVSCRIHGVVVGALLGRHYVCWPCNRDKVDEAALALAAQRQRRLEEARARIAAREVFACDRCGGNEFANQAVLDRHREWCK